MYFQPPGLAALGGQANWVKWAMAQVMALTWYWPDQGHLAVTSPRFS